jgi:delta 1-pyrroline-5-carboxylate dehydrogenase
LGAGVDPARVPSANEELFGPIVHVIPYTTPEEAVRFANSVPYALTAGIFAQSAADVDFFTRRLDAGNVYVNRPITAARVGVEPFGGFKRSGTGPKAGGDEYVLAFVTVAPRHAADEAALLQNIQQASHSALAPRPTVDIPGQRNRMVYDRPLGSGLVLAEAPADFRHAVLVAALATGNSVTIIAEDEEEALDLRKTATRLDGKQPGLEPLHVMRARDAEALAAISAYDFVAGSGEALRAVARAYAEHPHPVQLPAFISPDNGPPPDLAAAFVRRFVRPRLIAENTLRHGALISTGGLWD